MAVAMLAVIPAAASADVPRCDASVTTGTTIKTATFTVTQPRNSTGQWNETWKQDFTVVVQPDGSFTGTGVGTNGETGEVNIPRLDITGKFGLNAAGVNTVTYTGTTPGSDLIGYLTDAPMDNTAVTLATTNQPSVITWDLEFKVSAPVFTTDATTTPTTESVKNHGQYVKALGSGKVAAQACAGMPVNSTQGVK